MSNDPTVHAIVESIALIGALTSFVHLLYDVWYAIKHDQPLPPAPPADATDK